MSLTQICAWCQAGGVRTILVQDDEPGESHGCCAYHATELHAEAYEHYLKTHPGEIARLTGEP